MERYQEGKEALTGIAPEPWHFRYVGLPHATIMNTHGFCLEEYLDYLKDFPYEGRHRSPNRPVPGEVLPLSWLYRQTDESIHDFLEGHADAL